MTLAVTGTLDTWNVAFEPATVTLAANGTATTVMTVEIPQNAEAQGNGIDAVPVALTVTGTTVPAAEQGDEPLQLTIAIKNALIVPVAAGAESGPDTHLFPRSTTIHV